MYEDFSQTTDDVREHFEKPQLSRSCPTAQGCPRAYYHAQSSTMVARCIVRLPMSEPNSIRRADPLSAALPVQHSRMGWQSGWRSSAWQRPLRGGVGLAITFARFSGIQWSVPSTAMARSRPATGALRGALVDYGSNLARRAGHVALSDWLCFSVRPGADVPGMFESRSGCRRQASAPGLRRRTVPPVFADCHWLKVCLRSLNRTPARFRDGTKVIAHIGGVRCDARTKGSHSPSSHTCTSAPFSDSDPRKSAGTPGA
jgi:hypothetical protein